MVMDIFIFTSSAIFIGSWLIRFLIYARYLKTFFSKLLSKSPTAVVGFFSLFCGEAGRAFFLTFATAIFTRLQI